MWQRKSTETIFEHPRITLLEDTVVLPNGQESKYMRFGDYGDVVTLIVEDGDQILLQSEYAYPVNANLRQFPEGFIEDGENWEQAASRELAEECGLKAETLQKIGEMLIMHRRTDAKHHIIMVTDITEVPAKPEDTEQITTGWQTRSEINQLIADGEIVQKNTLAAWSIYQATQQ